MDLPQPEPAAVPLAPTLFIGLGGSGIRTLALVRQRINDRFGDPDYWPVLGFAGIDCDEEEIRHHGTLRRAGLALRESDLVSVSLRAAELRHVYEERHGPYKHISHLLPDCPPNWRLDCGSGQVRGFGRLCFIHHVRRLRELFLKQIRSISHKEAVGVARQRGALLAHPAATDLGPLVDVVITTSLAGGFGSGCMLDAAYLARAIADSAGCRLRVVRAALFLPDLFEGSEVPERFGETFRANAYAALRELEHLNRPGSPPFSTRAWGQVSDRALPGPPFDVAYLFSLNGGGPTRTREDFLGTAACGLTALLGLEPEGARMRAREAQAIQVVRRDGRGSVPYSSLGISRVIQGHPRLLPLAANRLVRRLLGEELRRPAHPGEHPLDAVRDSCLASCGVVEASKVEGLRLEAQLSARRAETAGAARRSAERALHALDTLVRAVPGKIENQNAERLRNAAAQVAGERALQAERIVLDHFGLERGGDRLRHIAHLARKTAPEPVEPQKTSMPEILTEWESLEGGGLWNILRQARRRRSRLREEFAGWLGDELEARIRILANSIERYHRVCLAKRLRELATGMEERSESAEKWISKLESRCEYHLEAIEQSPEVVLGDELADANRQRYPRDETALDEAIDAALAAAEVPPELLRERFLVRVGTAVALEPPGGVLAGLEHLRRIYSDPQGIMETAASDLLSEFLPEEEVYVALSRRGTPPKDLAAELVATARPICMPDPNHLAGVIELRIAAGPPPDPVTAFSTEFLAALAARGWHGLEMRTDAKAITLAHAVHGVPLSGLDALPHMREAYRRRLATGEQRGHHVLEKNVIRELPEP